MRNMLQSESEAVVGRLQPRCAVDEDDCIIAKMDFDGVRKTHFPADQCGAAGNGPKYDAESGAKAEKQWLTRLFLAQSSLPCFQ